MLLAAALCLLWAPASAGAQAGENAGAGVARGSIVFAAPVDLGGGCQATDFTFSGGSDTVVVNTVLTAYVGPVNITGSGRDSCPSGASESGSLSVTVGGTGPTGSEFECGSLSGTYTRLLTAVTVNVSGECSVNGFPAGDITFLAEAVVTPDPGFSFETAEFVAPFSIVPD